MSYIVWHLISIHGLKYNLNVYKINCRFNIIGIIKIVRIFYFSILIACFKTNKLKLKMFTLRKCFLII